LLGFGAMRLPLVPGGAAKDIDLEAVSHMIEYAIENGVNYFDTAYVYHEGRSEIVLGELLRIHPREKFFLADKLPTWNIKTAEDIDRYFNEQLQRCKVDYFDYYLVHNFTHQYIDTIKEINALEILERKRKEGKIRYLGVSCHDTFENLKTIVSLHDWDFVQLQINYLDWTLLKAKETYEYVTGLGIPVIVMEPLRGGTISQPLPEVASLLETLDEDRNPVSLALRFAGSLENVPVVLSGMSSLEQVKENITIMDSFTPITDRENEVLMEAAEIHLASGEIPCTGCRYCMECPSGVEIPRILALYNEYLRTGNEIAFDACYITFDKTKQAHNCTECRICEEHCPQNIEISAFMKDIAALANLC